MSYIVLARKYRPQNFDEMVGQEGAAKTLLHAIQSARVAHAYIFSGPRGVGKTTLARLLAKCLNCEKGPTTTPCQRCPSCLTISQGSSVDDVLEIDGASNRGIEQIRDLRESAKYVPTASRYRIFIIDEAHQITRDAFGALLKILEEPPGHVIFMLATTEVQKIPAPILSRCQRFSLRPIPSDLVLKQLEKICRLEKIKADEEALAHIVRFVEGSLRDALSLLDQALVFSPEGITSQTLRDLLGLLPSQTIRDVANELKKGEPASVLKKINQLLLEGVDLTQLARDLQDHYHALLLEKAGVEDTLGIAKNETKAEAAQYDYPTLERNIRLLSRALEDMRHSETPRAIFEIYALRLAQKTLDPIGLLKRLEEKGSSLPLNPVFMGSRGDLTPSPFSSPPVTPPVVTKSNPQPSPSSPWTTAMGETVVNQWGSFLHDVSEKKAALGAALEDAHVSATEKGLKLTFKKSFQQQMVFTSKEILKPLFLERFGHFPELETAVEIAPVKPPEAPLSPPLPRPSFAEPKQPPMPEEKKGEDTEYEEIAPHQTSSDVQKVLKHFPGTLKREKKKT